MKSYQEIFRRYEKKYLMEEAVCRELLKRLQNKMEGDRFGNYRIENLYFDTDQYEIIRKSLEKPVYKEKLRLRSYGTPGAESQVFLELKKKYKSVVYKRRISMTQKEAMALIGEGKPPKLEGFVSKQIMKEIQWFLEKYHPELKVFIGYERQAFSGIEDPNFRLTIDRQIRYRTEQLDLSAGGSGKEILPSGLCLMEVKIPGAIPLWMVRLLEELEIRQVSFSKYGTCYQNFLKNQKKEIKKTAAASPRVKNGGKNCA